jgi:hypothetical protein
LRNSKATFRRVRELSPVSLISLKEAFLLGKKKNKTKLFSYLLFSTFPEEKVQYYAFLTSELFFCKYIISLLHPSLDHTLLYLPCSQTSQIPETLALFFLFQSS